MWWSLPASFFKDNVYLIFGWTIEVIKGKDIGLFLVFGIPIRLILEIMLTWYCIHPIEISQYLLISRNFNSKSDYNSQNAKIY